METNKNNSKLIGVGIIALVLGYLIYPQINRYNKVPMGMHQMPDGSMMLDVNSNMHTNMTMGSMMEAMTANLSGKSGTEFDSAFLEEMIPHHMGAIEMAQMVLKTSKNPELIKLANDIISAQQKEINMMRGWQREWFGIQPE
jgi:uncharacterized protein (DUF305 family)